MLPVLQLRVLHERPFRLQFLAQAASVLGDNLAPIAIAFAVLDLSGSATDLGIVLAANTVTLGVFLFVGGVLGDRVARRRIMVTCDLVRFGTQGAFGVLLLTGYAQIWQLVLLQAIKGVATAFFSPAAVGLTPQTVSENRLQHANALLSVTISSAGIAGPAIAGLLVATVGSGWALIADACSFALSAVFLARLRVPAQNPRAMKQGFSAEFLSGWKEIQVRPWVLASIVNFMLFQLLVLASFQILGPVIARQSLGGAAAWAAIMVSVGVGSLIGDLLGFAVSPRRPLFAAFLTLMVVVPVMVLLALRAWTPLVALGALMLGIAFSFPTILWFTTLQERIPSGAISRVSSFDWMGSMVLRPVGYAVMGPLAAAVGSERALLGAAGIYAIANAATLSLPGIVSLQRKQRMNDTVGTCEPAG